MKKNDFQLHNNMSTHPIYELKSFPATYFIKNPDNKCEAQQHDASPHHIKNFVLK